MKLIEIFMFITVICISHNIFGQKSENYFIPYDGDTVFMYKNPGVDVPWSENDYAYEMNYDLHEQYLYYYDANGDKKHLDQTKLKEMFVGGRYFDSRYIKGNKGKKRLHEVLVTGKDFSITQHWAGGEWFFLYIWDKNGDLVKGQIVVSKRLVKDKENYNEYVKPLIKNCPEIKEQIESNFDSEWYNAKGWGSNYRNNMFFGVVNATCD